MAIGTNASVVFEVRHTADLGAGVYDEIRVLLAAVFDDLTDADCEHALGGLHVCARSRGELVGHVSVVQRRLLHGGRALRTGYVEAFGVIPRLQRQRIGSGLMAEAERVIRAGYELGALGATDMAIEFYRRRGWKRWRGRTLAFTPSGTVRTPDDDNCIYVLEVSEQLDVYGDLVCDFREGDLW